VNKNDDELKSCGTERTGPGSKLDSMRTKERERENVERSIELFVASAPVWTSLSGQTVDV
jgi:hypothetical protein